MKRNRLTASASLTCTQRESKNILTEKDIPSTKLSTLYMKKMCFLPFKIVNDLSKKTSGAQNSPFYVYTQRESKEVVTEKEISYREATI